MELTDFSSTGASPSAEWQPKQPSEFTSIRPLSALPLFGMRSILNSVLRLNK